MQFCSGFSLEKLVIVNWPQGFFGELGQWMGKILGWCTGPKIQMGDAGFGLPEPLEEFNNSANTNTQDLVIATHKLLLQSKDSSRSIYIYHIDTHTNTNALSPRNKTISQLHLFTNFPYKLPPTWLPPFSSLSTPFTCYTHTHKQASKYFLKIFSYKPHNCSSN